MKNEWAFAISESARKQGNLLRRIRESSGLTMRQLAMQIGLSHTAISQLEHGKLELPRMRIEQIVVACGHSMKDFELAMGKGFVEANYREECESLIRSFDEGTLRVLYSVMKMIKISNSNEQVLGGLK